MSIPNVFPKFLNVFSKMFPTTPQFNFLVLFGHGSCAVEGRGGKRA